MACRSIALVWHCVPFTKKKHQALKSMMTIITASGVGYQVTAPDLLQGYSIFHKKEAAKKISYDFGLRLFDDRESVSLCFKRERH